MVRTFCMDFGSPMGSEFRNAPMTLLHPESIVSGPIYVPYLVIGHKWAPSSSTRPWGPGITVRKELWGSICFLLRIAGRVILGYLFGKHKTGGLLKLQYDSIPMGRENISKLMTNNTTAAAAPEKKQE